MSSKQPGSFIKHLIDAGLKRHRSPKNNDDFSIHRLDLSELKLRTSRFTPFVIANRLSGHTSVSQEELQEVLRHFTEFASSVKDEFSVLLVGMKLDHESLNVDELREQCIVILDETDMETIEQARGRGAKYNALGTCLKRYLGLRALSPYVPSRPAVAGRFFGRNDTLSALLAGKEGANYTFVGNRRIGKTSMLREIKDKLSIKSDQILFADLYGANCDNAYDVIHGILGQLDPRAIVRLEKDPRNIKLFPKQILDLTEKQGLEVAVFVDEVDRILAFDESSDGDKRYQVLNLLRSAFEHQSCRIFFAGFRGAIAAVSDINNPLYNFTKPKIVGQLSREDAIEMVRLPFARLGYELEDTNLPGLVYRETGGHPELVQMVCEKIVDVIARTGRVPEPTELLRAVYEEEFELRIFQTFIANTDAQERLLCYLLARDAGDNQSGVEQFAFTNDDARRHMSQQLGAVDPAWVKNMLRNLSMSSVIVRVPGTQRWKFAVPQLARYCIINDIDRSIDLALEEAMNAPAETTLDWPKVKVSG